MKKSPWSLGWFRASLRVRLAALLLSVTLVPTFVIFYLILSDRAYRDAIQDGRRVMIGVTSSVTDHLSRALETTDIVLLDIATRLGEGGEPWDTARTTTRLRELPYLRALLVTDASGRVRYSSVDALVGMNIGTRPWFQAIGDGPRRLYVGAPEAGRFLAEGASTVQETRRWSIPLARPVLTPAGGFRGSVVALLNPDYLTMIGARAAQAFGVTVHFHSVDGTMLATSLGEPDGIGVRFSNDWLFRDFLPARDHGTEMVIDGTGVPVLASFAVAQTGLVVVEVEQPMREVLASAREKVTELRVGIGAIAVMTLVTLLILSLVSAKVAREQMAARNAELLRAAAEREAELLLTARGEMQRLLGGLPSIIFRAERAGNGGYAVGYVAGNIQTVTGWPPDALATEADWSARLSPGTPPFSRFMDSVNRVGEGHREYRLRQPNGTWRWLRTVAMVLARGEDGHAEIVGHISDITAERAATAQLAASARLASLGEMASGLAHELRQPLAIMSTAAENMVRALAQDRLDLVTPRAKRIVEQADRASRIIEHLRRFARGSDEGAPRTAFGLDEAMAGASSLVRSALQEASVDMEMMLGSPAPIVLGHLVALEQVLVNLLLNACQAMEQRDEASPRRITVRAGQAADAGCVFIAVSDTGGGIAEEVLPRMFEPFITTKGPEKGTGLGLSICHGLIRAMGGTIEARNENAGAVFTITLQAAAEATRPEAV